jgi:hypothetical protein
MPEGKFQWDYSYFKWQDIPIRLSPEMLQIRNIGGRTWITGRTSILGDVSSKRPRNCTTRTGTGCRDRKETIARGKGKLPDRIYASIQPGIHGTEVSRIRTHTAHSPNATSTGTL